MRSAGHCPSPVRFPCAEDKTGTGNAGDAGGFVVVLPPPQVTLLLLSPHSPQDYASFGFKLQGGRPVALGDSPDSAKTNDRVSQHPESNRGRWCATGREMSRTTGQEAVIAPPLPCLFCSLSSPPLTGWARHVAEYHPSWWACMSIARFTRPVRAQTADGWSRCYQRR